MDKIKKIIFSSVFCSQHITIHSNCDKLLTYNSSGSKKNWFFTRNRILDSGFWPACTNDNEEFSQILGTNCFCMNKLVDVHSWLATINSIRNGENILDIRCMHDRRRVTKDKMKWITAWPPFFSWSQKMSRHNTSHLEISKISTPRIVWNIF